MAGTDQGNSPQTAAHIVAALAGVVVFLALWGAFSMNLVLALILGLVVGVVVFFIMSRMQPGGEAGDQLPSSSRPPSATVPPATATPVATPLSGVTKDEERQPAPDTAAQPEAPAAPAPEAPAPEAPAPAAEPAPAADDLKRINGIGPAIEKKLNALGVQSYAQIAGWDEADIARFDEAVKGRGRIARDDWVGQARALAGSGAQE